MIPTFLVRTCLSLALLSLGALAFVHEDDPKLLDRVAPFGGPGYTPGAHLPRHGRPQQFLPPTGSTSLLGTGLGSGSIQFPAQSVTLLSWLPLGQLAAGANSGNDCWGYVAPSGREYALIGLSNGTAFVEISDPSDPQVISFQSGSPSLWRDVKTYESYAYAVSEGGGGIQIFDLGNIDNGQVNLVNTVTSGGTQRSHNVAIDTESGYLYRCGGASDTGLRIYNLSNPTSPQFVGSWHGRYVHDVQVVTYTSGPYAGREIAFACGGFGNGSVQTGLSIVDVTNKNNPQVRAQYQYPGGRYSHQAWLSEDRQVLYLDDELDENGVLPTTTHVIDVSDIDDPQHVSTFTNGNSSIGHNLYTKGNLVFEANYRSGLRVFDVSSPLAGVEVASFDTWPGDDTDAFNGLWSCYPYFPSGVVIGSDLEKGLFVWWVGTPPVSLALAANAPELIAPGGDSLLVTIAEDTPGDLAVGSARLFFDAGLGLVEVPLVALGGDDYRADFPATTCGAEVRWFIGARSQNGTLWTLPDEAPFTSYRSLSGDVERVALEEDFEVGPAGWIAGDLADTATAGIWELGVPVAGLATPDSDHTPGGSQCWLTGANSDVGGGFTSLTSPNMDLAGWNDPILSFWYWFSKGEGSPQPPDKFSIRVSVDGGAQWTLLEAIDTPQHASIASWRHASFRLKDFVVPTGSTRVRFMAADVNIDSIIEACVDDLRVSEALCGCSITPGCSAAANSVGAGAQLSVLGSPSLTVNDLELHSHSGVPGQFGVHFYGPGNFETPFGDGSLCVSGGTFRLQPPQSFNSSGEMVRVIDLAAPPTGGGQSEILAGSTWYFQVWYRDPAGPLGNGYNLSSSLGISFCP
jgi:choice-of-anchor B domain-containing protein